MVIVLLAVLLLVPQSDSSIRVEYDRFKNVTAVTTIALPLKEPKTPHTLLEATEAAMNQQTVAASFTYYGKVKRTPRFITLSFYFPKRYFGRNTSLIALVDGEQIVLPSVSDTGESRLSLQVFRRLTRGKGIELQIGSEEFALPDETLQAFKEIERHTRP